MNKRGGAGDIAKTQPPGDSTSKITMNLGVPKAQVPALGSAQVAGGRSGKVDLKPGHSLMDWIRLGKSGKDLTGVGGEKLTVTMDELLKHSTTDDCWMVLRGMYGIRSTLDDL